jgi:F-type H+-transporting ATPase subunit delta
VAAGNSSQHELAERYAKAVFELADEAKDLDTVAEDLRTLKAMLGESEDLARLVRSPVIGRREQAKAMAALAERAGFSGLTRKFLGAVAMNRRLFAIRAIIDAYLAELAARRGEVTARVTAARDLTEAQRDALAAALRDLAGGKVALEVDVDPGILGGLVVRLGSRMYDNSVASKLRRMQLAMKGVG